MNKNSNDNIGTTEKYNNSNVKQDDSNREKEGTR